MPWVSGDSPMYDPAPRSFGAPTLSTQMDVSRELNPGITSGLANLAGYVGFGALDLADTVASSVPGLSSLTGMERGDLNMAALRALDMPGFSGIHDSLASFYNQRKGGIELASGVMGIVASELIVRRFMGPASAFMRGVSKLPFVRRLATLDAEYANAMNTVRNVDRTLAARGAQGMEQYAGRVTIDGMSINRATGEFVTKTVDISRRRAVFQARGLGALTGAAYAAKVEGVMAVGLNQNGFLYHDDAADNLFWMAVGIGPLGAGVEWIHSGYQLRKFVNSDEIRRTFANAMDPSAIEEGRLIWHGKKVDPENQPGTFFGGAFTDDITSLLTNVTTLKATPTDLSADGRALLGNRDSLATQYLKLAREEMQKVTTKGISTDGRTRFSMDSRGYGNHLDMITYRDPGAVYGMEMVGGVADDTTVHAIHSSHTARVNERIDEVERAIADAADDAGTAPEEITRLQLLRRRLEFERDLVPRAAIDGEFVPISEAAAIEQFVEPGPMIRFTERARTPAEKGKQLDRHGMWEYTPEHVKGSISLDSDFIIHLPGKRNLNTLDHFDVLRLYRIGERAINEMVKFSGPLNLPKNPNFFQLDMAEEILRRTDGRAQVIFPEGMNRASAQVESLVQKAEGLKIWDDGVDDLTDQMSKLRVRYNLPRLTTYEQGVTGNQHHAAIDLLRGIAGYGPKQVRKMSLTELQEAAANFKRIGDIAPVTPTDMDLFGASFKYMLDESGQPLKPLIAYFRPLQQAEWTKEFVAERLAARKLHTVASLTDDKAAPLTKLISESTITNPDVQLAARTHELMDTQIQGSLMGAAPQSAPGAFGKSVITSEMRDRDNPILLAATRVRESVNRQVRDATKVVFNEHMGDVLGRLDNPRNAASKLLIDQFHSFSSGWELLRTPVAAHNGHHGFTLANTAANRERFRMMFGRDLEEGQVLLSPSGKQVVLDDLALEAQQRFNKVTDSLIAEKNTLLRSQGRSEIQPRSWYTPPPNTNGKLIGFTIGPDGKTVPGMTVVASSPQEFARARRVVEDEINKLGIGYSFRTQDQIKDFASIWDRAQMDFIDPGTTAIQPNRHSRGALAGMEVRVNAFAESVRNVHGQFQGHADDLIEVMFKDSINSAKMRANMATDVTRNRASFYRDQKYRSIHDMYLENLLGTSKLNSQNSMVGRIYNGLEGTIDAFLSSATPGAAKVWTATTEWLSKSVPWSKTEAARKDFETLSQKLGDYMPFESAAKLLEARGAGATPLNVAKLTGRVNGFSAAVLLRMFEVAHPIMNLSGIVNALPAVVRQMSPRVGETSADFAARIGHTANIFDLGDGRIVGSLDMTKIGGRAFSRAWKRSSHADFDFMVRRGYLSQEVAEFHRQLGAIESRKTWEAFFVGDPNKKGFMRKGVVGWTSVLSDKSEDFSRSWGHMAGLEIADILGIQSREARHAFAHDVANKMIANYSPLNRPEIFQGALGAPIGLFQSFVYNYWQRLFRYVETKDFRSLGTQYAMQGSLFGAVTLPGWSTFNAAFADKQRGDGPSDPTSALWNRLGPAGDLVGGGLLSMIPTLFGAPAVDLYSRGDTNVRQFSVDIGGSSLTELASSFMPSFNVLQRLWQGMGAGLRAFSDDNPALSPTQLAEVASNMIANRPLAGWIEQFAAGGNDTDSYGQLVSDTKNWAETTYRLLGLRSMQQSRQVQAFYTNRGVQENKAAADDLLRQSTRAAMREGNWDALPAIVDQYLKNGGDPRFIRRWIREQYNAATKTRSTRQLESALRNPSRMDEVIRLLDSGVTIESDEATTDGTLGFGSDPSDELSQPESSLGTLTNESPAVP